MVRITSDVNWTPGRANKVLGAGVQTSDVHSSISLLLPLSVQGSIFSCIDALLGEFRVGGGVHDSYTFHVDWWDHLLPLA